MSRVREFGRWLASQGPIVLAFVLLAAAALIASVAGLIDERSDNTALDAFRHQLNLATFEQECRFELSTPVSQIQADKLDALALGLVAVIEDDDTGLAVQTARIRDLSRREREALEARAGAVATCDRRARERYE